VTGGLCARAALPFICLNVLAGGLVLYGLAGLRYEGWAVAQFAGLLLLQSLVAIQVAMFAVYLTPNQARRAPPGGARGLSCLLARSCSACMARRHVRNWGKRMSWAAVPLLCLGQRVRTSSGPARRPPASDIFTKHSAGQRTTRGRAPPAHALRRGQAAQQLAAWPTTRNPA